MASTAEPRTVAPISHRVETTMKTAGSAAVQTGSMGWIGAAGITFAVLFLVGFSLVTWTWDDEAEILAWYGDGAHRVQQVVGMFAVALAGLAFLAFLAGLRTRLQVTGEDFFPTVMMAAGLVFTMALFSGAAALVAVSGSIEIGDGAIPTNADIVRVVDSIGYGTILAFGALAAALCLVSASRAGQRSRVFPTWLNVTGYAAAGVLLFGVFYLPLAALPLWALAVGIWGVSTRAA